MTHERNRRILVIDDNPAIHDDFRKLLASENRTALALASLEMNLFDGAKEPSAGEQDGYELDAALHGEAGLSQLEAACLAGRPYALAFVDIRMPGWNGADTVERLWQIDAELEVVFCTAYSDVSEREMLRRLGSPDRYLILKKPFDQIEVRQLARSLTEKWTLRQKAIARQEELERQVDQEVSRRHQVELELRHAQKLEAVARLAAGLAHEINNPSQFVSDSILFLHDSVPLLFELIYALRALSSASPPIDPRLVAVVQRCERELADANLETAMREALVDAREGMQRITGIVRAMGLFGHPGGEKRPADLNQALLSTLSVAKAEYRTVADVETTFAELPKVMCHLGDLNQVFLNLIVNAAQAIGEANTAPQARGSIAVETALETDDVVRVTVKDSGCGIPLEIQDKVFDPFFTTRPIGKGSGQGLAIARAIVVDRHGGTLTFESRPGAGTSFHLRLPVDGQRRLSTTP